MKRVFGLVSALVLLLGLCACGNGGSDNENGGENSGGEVHTHAFGAWTTVTESTCAVAGSQQRVCDCGEKETVDLALNAHTASDWIVDKSEDGHQYQKCTVCGAILKEETISKDTVGSQGLAYTVNDDGKTCTITGIGACEDTDLMIPEEIDGCRVTKISQAFYYCDSIKSVVIPNSVTNIAPRSFQECKNLQSVVIPGSVREIPQYAFKNCVNLQCVELYDGLTTIDYSAFENCQKLQSVKIPNSVKALEDSAFLSCISLESVVLSDSITYIASDVFAGCVNLREINISNGVESIYGRAFSYCYNLESVVIPATVRRIETFAFAECNSLQRVQFTGTVAQWKAITQFDEEIKEHTIYCTDGIIEKK